MINFSFTFAKNQIKVFYGKSREQGIQYSNYGNVLLLPSNSGLNNDNETVIYL